VFKALFGSEKKGRILLYLYTNGEAHATEIAKVFKFYLNTVQNQLLNMERDGILYSKHRGKVSISVQKGTGSAPRKSTELRS